MTLPPRQAVAAGLMVAILCGGAAWSVNWMIGRRQAARSVSRELAACEAFAREIESLRQKPKTALTQAMDAGEVGTRIQVASSQAGLGESSIQGITPQPPRRVGDSPCVLKPTALSLRGVSLPALAAFLYHLTGELGLSVGELRLRSPSRKAAPDAWDADVTVTCLVYSPLPKARQGS